jgi:homoprotocatechuate degradation regulator HpaR
MRKYRKNLPLLLLTVREAIRANFQPTLRKYGITEQQWRILRALHEAKLMGVTEIADACLIFRPSIVGIVQRMEEMNLVKRAAVKTDKRRVNISLTPRGKALVNEIMPIFDAIYQQLENAVGAEKLDTLYHVLDDMMTHLGELSLQDGETATGTEISTGTRALSLVRK